jgi:hypothetical protein
MIVKLVATVILISVGVWTLSICNHLYSGTPSVRTVGRLTISLVIELFVIALFGIWLT